MHKDQIRAWIALGWLCHDMGVALVNCPREVLERSSGGRQTFEEIMAENGVRVLHDNAGLGWPGLSIYGLSVCYHNGTKAPGQPCMIAARNAKGATWADLVASIESARWAVGYVKKGKV